MSLCFTASFGQRIATCPCRDENESDRNNGNNEKPKEKEQLKLSSRTFIIHRPGLIKSVQTALSSIDLITTKRKRKETRKIKSHEDVRIKRRKDKKHDDIIEWLHEVYKVKMVKYWSERLQRIAEKLRKPGGEEKLRTKIEKYLKKVPSQFSECDEYGKEFRENLPENIIQKLKKIYFEKEKLKSNNKLAIPKVKLEKHDSNLKKVIRKWLANVPIKQKDFLARPIKKQDIIDSLAYRLEPFVLHRPNLDDDYRCMLKSYTMEIVHEIPIDVDSMLKRDYVNTITDELVDGIINVDTKNQSAFTFKDKRKGINNCYDCQYNFMKKIQQPSLKVIKDFVNDEITKYLESSDLVINRKRMGCIEAELNAILLNTIRSIEPKTENNKIEEICSVFKDIGNLPEDQARDLSHSIYTNFKECFREVSNENPKSRSFLRKDYSENYVFYNPVRNLYRTKNASSNLSDKDIEANVILYTNEIANQIDHWLTLLHIQTPFAQQPSFREMAVGDLARDIVDRRKYFELNPYSQITDIEELDHLKFQIFKWIGKLVGEENLEIIEYAPDLMRRIRSVPVPILAKLQDIELNKINIREPRYHISNENGDEQPQTYTEELYVEIFIWLQELPHDLHYCDNVRTRYQFAENLVDRIKLGIRDKRNLNVVIEKEVNFWITKALRTKPTENKIDQLKNIIQNILIGSNVYKKASLQREESTNGTENNTEYPEEISSNEDKEILDLYTKQITNQIDEWLINLIPQVQNNAQKDIFVKSLAIEILERYKCNELIPMRHGIDEEESENFKFILFKRMKKLVGDDIVLVIEHASDLMLKIKNIPAPTLIKNAKDQNSTSLHSNSTKQKSIPLSPKIDKSKDKTNNVPAFTSKNNLELQNSQNYFGQTKLKTELNSNVNNQKIVTDAKLQENKLKNNFLATQNERASENNISQISDATTQSFPTSRNSNDVYDQISWNSGLDESKKLPKYSQGEKSPIYRDNSTLSESGNPLNHVPILGYQTESQDDSNRCRLRSLSYTINSLNPNKTEVYQMPSFASGNQSSREGNSKSHSLTTNDVDDSLRNIPRGMTVNQTYQYFDKLFKEKIKDVPIAATTEDQKLCAEIARKGIYNEIWKTYFKLKSDPNTENDYGLFESIFEDNLDSMLDCLPQTPELEAIRHAWKLQILNESVNMLKYIHSITDAPSFRQYLAQNFKRKFLKARLKEYSDQLEHEFVSSAADAFILYSRFKNDDPLKANVYRQRLMKRLEELAEHVKKVNNIEFRFVDQNQLCQEAFKILGNVNIPNDETLNSEVEEILLGDEIEQWYTELPVKPIMSVFDDIIRNRMRELLTKKLHDLEKDKNPEDPTVEREMKHEISKFLSKYAELEQDASVNINYMADALTNRLRNRRLNALGFKTFEQEHPISSTFAKPEPAVLAPLINEPTRPNVIRQEIHMPGVLKPQNNQRFNNPTLSAGVLGTSRVAGPSTGIATDFRVEHSFKEKQFNRDKTAGVAKGSRLEQNVHDPDRNVGQNQSYMGSSLRGPPDERVQGSIESKNFNRDQTAGVPKGSRHEQVFHSIDQNVGHNQNYIGNPLRGSPDQRIQRPIESELQPIDEELEDEEHQISVKCRCTERVYMSRWRKLYYIDDFVRCPYLYDDVDDDCPYWYDAY